MGWQRRHLEITKAEASDQPRPLGRSPPHSLAWSDAFGYVPLERGLAWPLSRKLHY